LALPSLVAEIENNRSRSVIVDWNAIKKKRNYDCKALASTLKKESWSGKGPEREKLWAHK